jgi:4-amino-4-deoxy-L-arabinose transferase-like glycosyltransferase
MLYTAALYFGNDILPKYIHFAFGLLTAGLIFNYLRFRLNTRFALYGVFLFLMVPVIVKLSITAYVDLGLIFFTLLSLIYLQKWAENNFRLKYLLISAIGCGLGLGTKYNGLITLFLMTILVPFSFIRFSTLKTNRLLKPTGYACLYLFMSLVIFSPWMIRNIVWKQNPVYPLYDSWFHRNTQISSTPATEDGDNMPTKHMNHFLIRKFIFHESWWQTALIPVRIFFEGKDDDPAKFDGKLTPLIFLLPFFSLMCFRNKKAPFQFEIQTFMGFSGLFLLYAFVITDMRIRYIAPIVPPLVILSIIGLHALLTWIRTFRQPHFRLWAEIGIWIGILTLCPIDYLINQFVLVRPIPYLMGKIDRDAYITLYRPEYSVIQHANQNLPESARILAIFLGNRGYYFDREVVFDMKLPIPDTSTTGSDTTVEGLLHRQAITHLLIRYDLFDQWLGSLTHQHRDIISRFFQSRTRLLFSSGGHGLFTLQK